MQKKIFWASFTVLGLITDFVLPFTFVWVIVGTIVVGCASWWIAYRGGWF
jgi:hypothetical protein